MYTQVPHFDHIFFMRSSKEILDTSDCFRLFSACFYEPEKDLFLDENVCLNLARLLTDSPAAASAACNMHTALEGATQHDLILDYAALFVGPFELIAAPYGSVYLENTRRLMGDTTVAVQRFYRDEGLKVETKEPPDHVAVELEFMSFLAKKQAVAMEQKNKTESARLYSLQCNFFRSVMSWLPVFCTTIHGGAQTQYYRSLSECLGHFHTTCEKTYTSKRSDQSLHLSD